MDDLKTGSSSNLTYTVLEAASVLRLSRAKVYQLIEREGLPTVHFGRSVRVPVDLLHDWVPAAHPERCAAGTQSALKDGRGKQQLWSKQ